MLPVMALMRAPSPLHNCRVDLDLFRGLQIQKSPQSFHLAGSQDFDEGSGNGAGTTREVSRRAG